MMEKWQITAQRMVKDFFFFHLPGCQGEKKNHT